MNPILLFTRKFEPLKLITLGFLALFLVVSCKKDGGNLTTSSTGLATVTTDTTADTPATTASQTAYYIDASAGNDSNSGTESSPIKSLSGAEGLDFSTIKTIYLKRGETWRESFTFPTSGISLSAYGTGAFPLLDGRREISTWQNLGSDLYSSQVTLGSSEGLGNLSMDGSLLAAVAWSTDVSTTLGGAANSSFTYNYATSTLYVKISDSPANHSFYASSILTAITAKGLSKVKVENVNIIGFSLHGVNFSNCSSCSVKSSTISNIGGAVIAAGYLYAGNGIEFGDSSSGGIVDGVTVSNIFDSCLSPQTYTANQTASAFEFKNSTLSYCGFAGIEISVLSNGGTTGSQISNVAISNINISSTGNGWSGRRYGTEGHGVRIGADTGAGTISGVTLSGVNINGAVGDGVKVFGESGVITIEKSKIYSGSLLGVNVADASATGLKLVMQTSQVYSNSGYGLSLNVPNGLGLQLYQNSFYENGVISVAIMGQAGEALIKNNLFDGASAITHLYTTSALIGASLDYNCYKEGTNMFGYNASAYSTIAAFRTGESLEANGVAAAALNLTSASTGDLSLATGSPCRSVGDSGVGVSTDYQSTSYRSPPSMGALEY